MAETQVTLQELMHPPVITRVISQLATPRERFQNHYNTGIGGGANNPVGGKVAAFDIFDTTRLIAQGRPHGVGPGRAAPQPVGNQSIYMYRAHESIHLEMDRIFRNRPIGAGLGDGLVDPAGQRYITAQERHLAQKFKNNREFIMAHMFRGGFEILRRGDEHIPVPLGTGGEITVDFKIPATNQGDIGGRIANWQTSTTTIIDQLLALNAYSEELTGYALTDAWINNKTATYLINNEQIQKIGGTANTVFTAFNRTGETSAEGILATDLSLMLRGLPWLRWHIYDAGLNVGPYTSERASGTYTPFIPDDHVIFTPDPSSDWLEWYNGSEIVKQNVMDGGQEMMSFAAWMTDVIDPAGLDLKGLDSGLPALYVPKAIFYAKVTP